MPGFRFGTDQNGMLVANQFLGSYTSSTFAGPASFQRADPTRVASALQQMGISPAESKQLGQNMASNANRSLPANVQNRPLIVSTTTQVQDSVTIPIGQMMVDAQNSALAAQQQLSRDLQSIEANNAQLAVTNNRVRDILKEYSGQDFGQDQQAWEKWAVDLNGYAIQPFMWRKVLRRRS